MFYFTFDGITVFISSVSSSSLISGFEFVVSCIMSTCVCVCVISIHQTCQRTIVFFGIFVRQFFDLIFLWIESNRTIDFAMDNHLIQKSIVCFHRNNYHLMLARPFNAPLSHAYAKTKWRVNFEPRAI